MEALSNSDEERAVQSLHPNLLQHDPKAADGQEGFRALVRASLPSGLQLEIVRLFDDGEFVVTQAQSRSTGEDSFAVYRFADEYIAEMWVFSNPMAPPNKSGHTQVDGPREPQHLESTEANKAFVRSYYESFHLTGDRTQNDEFFKGDVMIRHEPGVQDGLSHFLHDVEELMRHRTIDEIKLLVGQGDLVFIAATGTHEGKPSVYIDLYRVENLKLVEHWGFPQAVPPPSERANQNMML